MNAYLVAVLSVLGLAIGQILFKISAVSWSQHETVFNSKTLAAFFLAAFIYALTSVAWVWVLQKIDLVQVYPLMALAFIFVPILAYYFLGESININSFIGASLIAVGVWVSVLN